MASKMYCTNCGQVAKPKKLAKGSFIAEVVFWIIGLASLLIFPPLILLPIIYSAWRIFSRRELICRQCKAPNPIPLTAPAAQNALKNTT